MRSIPLRGFDQQLAHKVIDYMQFRGTTFHRGVPTSIEKLTDGQYRVKWSSDSGEHHEEFNTILYATGRKADLSQLNLEAANVLVDPSSQKILVNEAERTSVDNIYSVGDCSMGRPELTPVAVQAGKLLSQRLFGGKSKLMDYSLIPTTVFTPMEYGTVGLSEEAAIEQYGEDQIEVSYSLELISRY